MTRAISAPERNWQSFCLSLQNARRLVPGPGVSDSAGFRAEGFRYLTRFLEAGIRLCVAHNDPDYPVLCRMIEHTMTWCLDTPDCLYLYAPLRGDASYSLSGWRGTASVFDVQVVAGHYATGDARSWRKISAINDLELAYDEDGHFELVLGGPARSLNWLPMREDAGFLMVRQHFNDWDRERPADLLIERIGASYPVPPARPELVASQLELLSSWLDRGGDTYATIARRFLGLPPNSMPVYVDENLGMGACMAGQSYRYGNFRCARDEAVLVEFTPPICQQWSIRLQSCYGESIDYASRQTSLNGYQSVLDSDGVFRAVIAHMDPGVANWLDTGANTAGLISASFLRPKPAPPVPELRLVKLADLDAQLPADTARIDPATREAILTRRRRAVIRRYRV